jgi:beta-N-acetylhexosaminidase
MPRDPDAWGGRPQDRRHDPPETRHDARVPGDRRRLQRRDVVRRRQLAVLAMAAVALLAGAVVGAGAGGEPAARKGPAAKGGTPLRVATGLSLEQQVGQLIILRFAGTTAPAYVRRALRRNRVAGAILFRDNASSPDQITALTRQLRASAGAATPLVCIDQEGGGIRILPWSPPSAAQPDQAAAGTVGSDARAAAVALRGQGIDVALAPVADVPDVSGSAMSGREFSSDPEAAGQAVAAAVKGWRAGGVLPTLKHFPGLGGATVNTDDGPATVSRTRDELGEDLVPFRAGIAAGAPLVMLSHAVYTALDPGHIASQSPAIAHDLLRGELGFKGVTMTDSLEAAAVRAVTPDPGTAALASVDAGVDLILTTGRGSYIRVFRALLARAKAERAFRARVGESAARIVALRAQM